MKSAGINIDQVIENVLAQRCDSLAGWWNLLIEKEQKKEARRQRKRMESRRISAASNLDPTLLPPSIPEGDQNAESREFFHVWNRCFSRFFLTTNSHLFISNINIAWSDVSKIPKTYNTTFSCTTSSHREGLFSVFKAAITSRTANNVFSGSYRWTWFADSAKDTKAGHHSATCIPQALVPRLCKTGDVSRYQATEQCTEL